MPKLEEMLNVEDNRTHVAVHRAVTQIGHALKDHGLFVTIDADGNYGVDCLPYDVNRKDERVSDRIRRHIYGREQEGYPLSALRISEDHAKKLAKEMAEMQLNYETTEAEIYEMLLKGRSRFLGLPVTVVY